MRSLLVCAILLSACTANSRETSGSQTAMDQDLINALSSGEVAEGFRLLFDGTSSTGWRGFRSESFPESGWEVAEGELRHSQGGGDIMTIEQFANFELRLEWNISEAGNSGVFFRVTGEGDAPYVTGPEMQVLDDVRHPDGVSPLTSAGSNYGLYPSPRGVVRGPGEWNEVRLIVDGAHVEHWLNGTKVVEYELWSDEWETLVSETKFADWPGYGRAESGYISLQDHGDAVAYRSIRINEQPRPPPSSKTTP
jgi:hypothetical protein